MDLKEVVRTINLMRADRIIDHYAIGGAVGAVFYLEPVSTLDVDVFILLATETGKLLVSLQPIFDYLKHMGCALEGEYVMIGGTPVQFLSPAGALGEEAVRKSVEVDLEGIPVCVMNEEYLAAIALETGRTKDKLRLLQFHESPTFNMAAFHEIVLRHNLSNKWDRFKKEFLSE